MAQEKTYTLADYRTRLQQLRDTFAREFPERAGTVFIVDQTNDPKAELAGAAKALNIDVSELKQNLDKLDIDIASQTGHAQQLVTNDGRTVWLTFGWIDAKTRAKGTDHTISEKDLFKYTKTMLHELGHALIIQNEPVLKRFDGVMPNSIIRYNESFAELYASDMLMRSGLAIPGTLDVTMAIYDLEHIVTPFHNYLPADEYSELRQRYYPNAPTYKPSSFTGFEGLRDSLERTRAIALAHMETGMGTLAAYANSHALETVIADLNERSFTPHQIKDWLRERSDIFPHVVQSLKAEEYIKAFGKTLDNYQKASTPPEQQIYPAYQSSPLQWSLERSAALASQKASQTGDPTDQLLAQTLLQDLLSADTMG